MGSMYCFNCTECGKKISLSEGIGFMFPSIYEEAIAEIKAGKWGCEYREIFEAHTNAAINMDEEIYYCKKCETPFSDINKSIYIPKEPEMEVQPSEDAWCVAAPQTDRRYVMPRELKETYRCIKKGSHKCPTCGGVGKRVADIDAIKPKCPKCGHKNLMLEFGLWD